MRGKLQYVKFPAGIYECLIKDVRAGVDAKGEDLIIVLYSVQSGPRQGQEFKERLRWVSEKFLKALGEPCEYGAEWNSADWLHKTLFVEVKYTPVDTEGKGGWPRFSHHATDPRLPEPPEASEPSLKLKAKKVAPSPQAPPSPSRLNREEEEEVPF